MNWHEQVRRNAQERLGTPGLISCHMSSDWTRRHAGETLRREDVTVLLGGFPRSLPDPKNFAGQIRWLLGQFLNPRIEVARPRRRKKLRPISTTWHLAAAV